MLLTERGALHILGKCSTLNSAARTLRLSFWWNDSVFARLVTQCSNKFILLEVIPDTKNMLSLALGKSEADQTSVGLFALHTQQKAIVNVQIFKETPNTTKSNQHGSIENCLQLWHSRTAIQYFLYKVTIIKIYKCTNSFLGHSSHIAMSLRYTSSHSVLRYFCGLIYCTAGCTQGLWSSFPKMILKTCKIFIA